MPKPTELFIIVQHKVLAFKSVAELAAFLRAEKADLVRHKRQHDKKNVTEFYYKGRLIYTVRPTVPAQVPSRALLPRLCTHRLGYNDNRW